jgi:hypothetical protein
MVMQTAQKYILKVPNIKMFNSDINIQLKNKNTINFSEVTLKTKY